MEGTEPPPHDALPGLPRSRAIIPDGLLLLFLPMLLVLGLPGLCLGSPMLHHIDPSRKMRRKPPSRESTLPALGIDSMIQAGKHEHRWDEGCQPSGAGGDQPFRPR